MEKKYSLEEALKEYERAFNKYLEADARVVAALEAYDKAQKEKARALSARDSAKTDAELARLYYEAGLKADFDARAKKKKESSRNAD